MNPRYKRQYTALSIRQFYESCKQQTATLTLLILISDKLAMLLYVETASGNLSLNAIIFLPQLIVLIASNEQLVGEKNPFL